MTLNDLLQTPKVWTQEEIMKLIGDPSKGISVPVMPEEFPPKKRVIFLNFIVTEEYLAEHRQELCDQYMRDMKGYSF